MTTASVQMSESEKTMKLLPVLKDEKGIALVTSLLLTLLSLTIIVTALYLMNITTKQSGLTKRYKTAMQASYGGVDLVVKDLLPQLLLNGDALKIATPSTVSQIMGQITGNFPGLTDLAVGPGYGSQTDAANCINLKLQNPVTDPLTGQRLWKLPSGAICSSSLKPKELPDFKFTVPAAAGSTPYTIYSKIVDTVIGNSDMSGVLLQGAGVADSQSGIVPQHIPYVFRVEVQAERSTGATENANLSVLYAY